MHNFAQQIQPDWCQTFSLWRFLQYPNCVVSSMIHITGNLVLSGTVQYGALQWLYIKYKSDKCMLTWHLVWCLDIQIQNKRLNSRNWQGLKAIKGTLSRVDMRSSIPSLRDLSRSTAIMEISVSWRILVYFAFKSTLYKANAHEREFHLLRNQRRLFVSAKVLVRLSEKKTVLVGAYAKGETCCVRMNVDVEQTINLARVSFVRQTQLSRHSRCLPFPYKKKQNNLIT